MMFDVQLLHLKWIINKMTVSAGDGRHMTESLDACLTTDAHSVEKPVFISRESGAKAV